MSLDTLLTALADRYRLERELGVGRDGDGVPTEDLKGVRGLVQESTMMYFFFKWWNRG